MPSRRRTQEGETGWGCRRTLGLCALALLLAAAIGVGAPAAWAAGSTLQIGSQTLSRCGSAPLSYCGRLLVPLDYRAPDGPRISLAYRWYPASSPTPGRAARTVVPVEGGPGYPSIGSVAGGYSVMYGGLLERWNMLALDNRGTGQSTPIDCPALQGFSGPTGTEAFQRAGASCAEALNHRWRSPGGGWVHASDLFTSAPAAQDLAALLRALQLGKVDLYGDSYGSFFAQVFAARFPHMLRSVILDSTYQTVGLDPWYRSAVRSMPAAFDAVCSRAPACAAAAPGSAWSRIGMLAQSLRERPVSGVVPGATGSREPVNMGVVGLVDLLNDAAGDPQIYRELDAAARALLDAGDPAPLLRLYDQRLAEDEAYFGLPAAHYSVGLYLAVSCLDYPQLFDMKAGGAARLGELQTAAGALDPATFSPFSTAEWLAQNQNTEAFTACLDWPSPTAAEAPTPGTLPLIASSLPVLVLGGELDTWTPPLDIPKVLAELGGHARFVELANATHVVGEGDQACGSTLIQGFLAHPESIDRLDTSCAPAVAPIHAVGVYAARLSEQPPLEPQSGSDGSPQALRLSAAAVATAGDAIARYVATEDAIDHGLEGGSVTVTHGGSVLSLAGDSLVPGVSVSGTVRLAPASSPLDGQSVLATLTAHADGLPVASLSASWTTAGANARAQVVGSVGRESVSGTLPAP